jgi:hypothetical protein
MRASVLYAQLVLAFVSLLSSLAMFAVFTFWMVTRWDKVEFIWHWMWN